MEPPEIIKEPKFVAPALGPQERNVQAIVPSFYGRNNFMFLTTPGGETLFLSIYTLWKSGFRVRPGDTILCDVEVVPGAENRRVVFIRKVNRRKK